MVLRSSTDNPAPPALAGGPHGKLWTVCGGSVGEEGGDIGLHVGTEGIADRYLMVVDYDISALYGTDFGEVHDE